MTKKEMLYNDYMKNAALASMELMEDGLYYSENDIWFCLAYIFDVYDNPADVIFLNLGVEDIKLQIRQYQKENGKQIGSVKVEGSILPDVLFVDDINKAKVKSNGEVWYLYRNDVDPFPSKPHAHNHNQNYKLHLGNGGLYRKSERFDKIAKKDLIKLRGLFEANYPDIKMPPLEV